RLALPIGRECDLPPRGGPGRLRVDTDVAGQPAHDPGRDVEHVDLRVAVLRHRERYVAPVGAPRGCGVDAEEGREDLQRPALEREETVEVRVAPHVRG